MQAERRGKCFCVLIVQKFSVKASATKEEKTERAGSREQRGFRVSSSGSKETLLSGALPLQNVSRRIVQPHR
jgi:hypothetical protein